MSIRNINFNYFQVIIKNRIISGLYSIYTDINNVYNSLIDSNKVNNKTISIDDLIKKALQNIPDLNQNLIEKEFKLILTENNLTEEVFDEIFYGIFLSIVYSVSDNKDFIKNIKPQLQNINKYDFIKKCYIEITRIILQNEYIYLINFKNNTLTDNVAYNKIIKECIIISIYNCINLKNIVEYSKKFKDVEIIPEKPKDYTNDLNELKQQIKVVSDNLTLLKNNINNYVPPQHMTETKIDIPSIDIPVGRNVFNEQNITPKKEVESSEIKKEDEINIKLNEVIQPEINTQEKTEAIINNLMILSENNQQNQINEPEINQIDEQNNKQEINQVNETVNKLTNEPEIKQEINQVNEQEIKPDINQIDNKPNDEPNDINKIIQTEIQNKINIINDTQPDEQKILQLPTEIKQKGGTSKNINEESDNIIQSLDLEASIDPNNIDIDSFLNKI